MKIALRIIAGIVVLFVVLLGAGVVALMTIDPNQYRDRLTAEVKNATGRELVIKGDLKVGISLIPTIVANDVTFANAAWGSRPAMVSLKRLETNLQILPLLSGDVRIGRIVLIEPDILLEVAADGRVNWDFGGAAAQETQTAPKPSQGSNEPAMIPVIDALSIDKGKFRYRDQKSKQDVTLSLDRVRVDDVGSSNRLKLDIAGAYNGAPFQLKGTADPIQKLMADASDYALDLEANALDVTARLKGTVGKLISAPRLGLDVAVSGKDLNATLQGAKVFVPELDSSAVPALGGFEISGRATGPIHAPSVENLKFAIGTTDALRLEGAGRGANGTYTLDRFQARIKGSDLGGTLSAATSSRVPDIKAALTAKHFDLADVLALLPKDEAKTPAPAAQQKGKVAVKSAESANDGRVFPADPLPLDGLKAANAQATVKIARLVVEGTAIDGLDATINLRDGKLTLDPLAATVAEGQLSGRAVIDAGQQTPVLDTNLTITKTNIGQMLKERRVTDQLTGKASGKMNARGSGMSVRAMMASLNGNTEVILENGQLATGFDNAVSGDLLGIVTGLGTTIVSGVMGKSAKQEPTKINCFVSRFDIKQGIAISTGLLFDTDKVTVAGEGMLDLRTERLDLKLKPEAKGGVVLDIAPVVEVTGTLANPRAAPSSISVLKGVAGLAILGPVGLLASAAGVGTSDQNPCVAALDQKRTPQQTKGPPAQQQPSNPVENITKGVQDTLRGIFGGGK